MTEQLTQTGTVNINGTSLSYTHTNPTTDNTIFMIHAGICDQRMWQAQIAHFSQDYQVITVDMHGFGQSGIPTETFAFHEDFFALLDHFGVEQTWILAASLGGAIAFDMALMQANRVRGLILVAPAIANFVYTGDSHPMKAQIDNAEEGDDLELVNELEIQMWFDGEGRSADDMNAEMRQLVLEMNMIALKSDDGYWAHEVEIEPCASERLSELTLPVLLIYGDLDIPASIERVKFIADGIPHAKLELIAGTAHLPNMEQPEQFNQIVDDFINSH